MPAPPSCSNPLAGLRFTGLRFLLPMQRLIVLDFDGVICDSAPENAATAWRVCQFLWPERFPAGPVHESAIARFCAVRPYMETGYQSILMTRMMQEGAPAEQYTTGLAEWQARNLARLGLTKPELQQLFGAERDRWIANDLEGWLSYNRYYPGAAEALARLAQEARLVILTTKERRFVQQLMRREGIDFAEADIYGLHEIRNKETTLAQFVASREFSSVTFVEDRLATLQRILPVPALAELRLAYAPWGYTTPRQRAEAQAEPRIAILTALTDLETTA